MALILLAGVALLLAVLVVAALTPDDDRDRPAVRDLLLVLVAVVVPMVFVLAL